jgi:hypothetical protein
MKKFQLYSEFGDRAIYGETLEEAVMAPAALVKPGKFERVDNGHGVRSVQTVPDEVIQVATVLGREDTSNITRGSDHFERVLVETISGEIVVVDAKEMPAAITDITKIIRIRNIPGDIHTALKKRAIDEGISMEALVLGWIEEKLK